MQIVTDTLTVKFCQVLFYFFVFFPPIPAFHRAVVLPLETMLLSEFCRDCSFITGSVRGKGRVTGEQKPGGARGALKHFRRWSPALFSLDEIYCDFNGMTILINRTKLVVLIRVAERVRVLQK